MLPSTERRKIDGEQYKKIWVYGGSMSGKTTFADKAPMPLMLNTDGNIKFVTAPFVKIGDTHETRGRTVKKTLGWVNFKNVIEDLKKGSEFETIVLDLVEDLYEMCRLYIYDRQGIVHESDDSFRAWDMVTNEYLNTMRELLTLDYNFILISHEDLTRDITKPSGSNITQIKPNLRDKISTKLVGMVDMVGRVLVDDDGKRTLSFKTSPVEFGGGRLPVRAREIPLEWEEIENLYKKVDKQK